MMRSALARSRNKAGICECNEHMSALVTITQTENHKVAQSNRFSKRGLPLAKAILFHQKQSFTSWSKAPQGPKGPYIKRSFHCKKYPAVADIYC
jgi:hypothetical protein